MFALQVLRKVNAYHARSTLADQLTPRLVLLINGVMKHLEAAPVGRALQILNVKSPKLVESTSNALLKFALQTQIADRTFVTLPAAFVPLATVLQIPALLATPVTPQLLLEMSVLSIAKLANNGKIVTKEKTLSALVKHAQMEGVNVHLVKVAQRAFVILLLQRAFPA
jgi:hypothetical protein